MRAPPCYTPRRAPKREGVRTGPPAAAAPVVRGRATCGPVDAHPPRTASEPRFQRKTSRLRPLGSPGFFVRPGVRRLRRRHGQTNLATLIWCQARWPDPAHSTLSGRPGKSAESAETRRGGGGGSAAICSSVRGNLASIAERPASKCDTKVAHAFGVQWLAFTSVAGRRSCFGI